MNAGVRAPAGTLLRSFAGKRRPDGAPAAQPSTVTDPVANENVGSTLWQIRSQVRLLIEAELFHVGTETVQNCGCL